MNAAPKHMSMVEPDEQDAGGSFPKRLLRTFTILACSGLLAFLISLALAMGSGFNRFWFVFFWVVLFLAGWLIANRRDFGEHPERLYLVIALSITLLFSWSMSVRTCGWDIGTHYRNILVFADWQGDIDHSVADVSVINISPIDTWRELSDGALRWTNEQEDALDAQENVYAETVEHPANPIWYVTSIEYLPYALVLRACRAIGLSFSRTFFIMRAAGGVFYSLITYLGMRKLRRGKMLYAVIALLPTSVFLASELGYSYWLLSLCLYGFASLVGMIQGSVEVSVWSLFKMLGSLFFGMLPRVVYFPLMFLCLLIPKERFGSERFALGYRALIVGAALATFGVWLVPRLVSGLGGGDSHGGEVGPSGQISYILTHPLEYAQTFLRFVLPPLHMESGGADVEGVNLVSGFLSAEASPGLLANYGYLPRTSWVYTATLWVVLIFTTLTDKDREFSYGVLPGVLSWLLSFVVFVLIVTALYIDFTPVGLGEIHGVQRRYLLPLLYPLLVFVGPRALGLRGKVSDVAYNGAVLACMAVVLLGSWWTSCVGLMV